jgi:hypothetical protein
MDKKVPPKIKDLFKDETGTFFSDKTWNLCSTLRFLIYWKSGSKKGS